MADDNLTPMQHRSCIEYIKRGGERGAGKEAAIAAGYAPGGAAKQAYDLLQLPKVKRIVDQEQRDSLDRTRVEADWIIDKLKDEATSEDNSGGERIRALELLGKIAGMFVEKEEVNVNVSSTFFASLNMDEPEAIEGEWSEVPALPCPQTFTTIQREMWDRAWDAVPPSRAKTGHFQ